MDNLAGVSAFVQAAETLSFVEAGRLLGVSASAIGKSIARLETRLGTRLLHRSTRSMTLTAEARFSCSVASAFWEKWRRRNRSSAMCAVRRAAGCASVCRWSAVC